MIVLGASMGYYRKLSLQMCIIFAVVGGEACKPHLDSDLKNAVDRRCGKGCEDKSTLENGVPYLPDDGPSPAAIARVKGDRGNKIQKKNHWATPYNIAILNAAARQLRAEFAGNSGSRSPADPLVVGDMSAQKGGRLLGHASHRMGLDTDVSFYDTRGEGPQGKPIDKFVNYVESANRKYFDAPRNLRFVELLNQEAAKCGTKISFIFAGPSIVARLLKQLRLRGSSESSAAFLARTHLTVWPKKHDDHFHVRVARMNSEYCKNGGGQSSQTSPNIPNTSGSGSSTGPWSEPGASNYPTQPLGSGPPENVPQFDERLDEEYAPVGEDCGHFRALKSMKAKVYATWYENPVPGPQESSRFEKGQTVQINRDKIVLCMDTHRTRGGLRLMEFTLNESPDDERSAPITLVAPQANFEETANPDAPESGDGSNFSEDLQEPLNDSPRQELNCKNVQGGDLFVTRLNGVILHEIDANNRRIGNLLGQLQAGDVVSRISSISQAQKSGNDDDPAPTQWLKVHVESGASAGQTGVVADTYLDDYTKCRGPRTPQQDSPSPGSLPYDRTVPVRPF
jgi:murein endopeptidase